MTEKLLTVKELITELGKLSDNTVIKVEYNQWLHNHPHGKIQLTLSIDDAKKVSVDDNERMEEWVDDYINSLEKKDLMEKWNDIS